MSRAKPEVIPFAAGHFDLIKVMDRDMQQIGVEKLLWIAQAGDCSTIFIEGRVVAIIGQFEHWPGVFEIFMIPSIYVPLYIKSFLPLIRYYLQALFDNLGAHRIQSTAWDTPELERWMQFIGFEKEGTLKMYTQDKQNYCMWARFK